MEYQTFIFNWRGQEEKTIKKVASLSSCGLNPVVINSDDTLLGRREWVHLGEDAYFSDQFNKAMSMFTGEVLFHVQGDAEYEDWHGLVEDSACDFDRHRWGVYAPNIIWTPHKSHLVDGEDLGEGVREVSNTDCTCWFIHRDILAGMRPIDTSINKIGWGVDAIIARISSGKGRKVLRTYRHTVYHPYSSGYSRDEAIRQMEAYLESMTVDEAVRLQG